MINTYSEIEKHRSGLTKLQSTGMAIGTALLLFQLPVVEAANIRATAATIIPPYHQSHVTPQRTIANELVRIRTILKPTVSDLASIFGVSRQAIYNWLSGEIPASLHADKIRDLVSAIDIFEAEGVVVTGQVLKRKIKEGKSLIEIVRDGGAAIESAKILVGLLCRESGQRKIMESRLANRAKYPVNPLDIGSPMLDERV